MNWLHNINAVSLHELIIIQRRHLTRAVPCGAASARNMIAAHAIYILLLQHGSVLELHWASCTMAHQVQLCHIMYLVYSVF